MRDKRPQDYLKIIVALLPEELLIENAIEDMTDEELAAAMDLLQPLLRAKLARMRKNGGAARD